MKYSKFLCAAAVAAISQGCDSSGGSIDDSDSVIARDEASSSVNVFDDQIAAVQPRATTLPDQSDNFLNHPDFENGTNGWKGCDGAAIKVSSDSQSGDAAMQLGVGECAYQVVSAIPNQAFTFSCFTKLTDDMAWSGMGMTASNGNWRRVSEAPTASITSGDFVKVQTSFTVPDNATFLSVWMHSDHGAVLDNCSLTLGDTIEPDTDFAEGDLLLNGDFQNINSNGRAQNWTVGCGGTAATNGQTLTVLNGTCVDQTLSANGVKTLADKSSTLSCMIEDVAGYADMGVYINDKPVKVVRIKPKHIGERRSLNVPVTSGENGFVSFYADEKLEISDCTYIAKSDEIQDVNPNDEIEMLPVDVPVVFESGKLEDLVRTRLGMQSTDRAITSIDMLELVELYDNRGEGSKIESLVGLEHAKNLQSIAITEFKVTDLSPLAELTKLNFLRLSSKNIVNIDAIAGLTALNYLYLRPSDSFTDISAVANLKKLKTFIVHGESSIADLSPLSGLNKLVKLHIYGEVVADMSPIATLPKVESLFTGGTLSNLTALAAGTTLVEGDVFAIRAADNDLSANSENLTALHVLNDRGVDLYISGANSTRVELPELSIGL